MSQLEHTGPLELGDTFELWEAVCNASGEVSPFATYDMADEYLDYHEEDCPQSHTIYRLRSEVYETRGQQ